MSLRVLTASHVAQVTANFDPDELVGLMAQVFSRFSSRSGDPTMAGIYQPHRITLPTPNHVALFMPSRVSSVGTAMKVVSVPSPSAPQEVKAGGLPASTIVLDAESARVKAIVNARRLTALRNAAGSLLATRLLLSNPQPTVLLAIGAGAQIEAHISLFLSYYSSFTTCIIFNRSLNPRVRSLISSMNARYPAVNFMSGTTETSSVAAEDQDSIVLQTAIQRANVIITATPATAPFFPSSYVSPGTHLCLIGSYSPKMHEIDTALVLRGGKIVVDSKEACLSEAGELIAADRRPSDLIELGELIQLGGASPQPDPNLQEWTPRAGLVQEVRSSGDVTIFKSVGLGIQDVAIASAVVRFAEKENIGTVIDGYDELE